MWKPFLSWDRQKQVNLARTNPCCKQLSILQDDIKSTLNTIRSYMFPQYICLLLQLDVRVFKTFWTKSHVFYFFSCLPWTSFPDGSHSQESACNTGDPGLISQSGRLPGEGNGNPFQYFFLEKSRGQRSLAGYSPWGRKEADMTERLTFSLWTEMIRSLRTTLGTQSSLNEHMWV